MEQFRDGQHVALRSAFYGTYLHADEDGRGVSLHPRRSSPNAAWVVHLLVEGGPYMLLYGASYGRYLAATTTPAPSGLRGNLVQQQDFDRREDECVLQWEAVRVASGDGVLLRNVSGRYLRGSDADATVDDDDGRGTTLRWVVEAITQRDSVTNPPHQDTREIRTIRFVAADSHGTVLEDWKTFEFTGVSAQRLKEEIAKRAGEENQYYVRAGRYGRLVKLAQNLPQNNDTLDVILLTNRSNVFAAQNALRENQDIPVQEALMSFRRAENEYESQVRIIQNMTEEHERRVRQIPWADLTKEETKAVKKDLKQSQVKIKKLQKELPNMEEKMYNEEDAYRRAIARHGNAADQLQEQNL